MEDRSNGNNENFILYRLKDIMEIFNCGETHAYKLLRSNGFPSIKINSKYYVSKVKLEKWLESNVGKEKRI